MKRATLVILILLGLTSLEFPSVEEVNEAIGYIEECRDIHVEWVDYLTENPGHDSTQVGDAEWHQEWVDRYNKTLDILYFTLRLVQLLNPSTEPRLFTVNQNQIPLPRQY